MSTRTTPATLTVTSRDGTTIAYEKTGSGPSVLLVDGAMCYRASGPARPLAQRLATRFTVYTYDRRGRGESGDTAPYAVEREIEDIAALIDAAGGSVLLYGISSGAALAMDAANALTGVTRLATYEAPFIVDDTHTPRTRTFQDTLDAAIAANRPGDAVKYFMRVVGVPAPVVAIMRLTPMWTKLTTIAHTLPYDARVLGDTGEGTPLSTERWSSVTVPTLVMAGGKSPEYMRNSQRAIADLLPDTRHEVLPGQTHLLKPDAVAPLLLEFFSR